MCVCVCVCVCVCRGMGDVRRSLPEKMVIGLRCVGCLGVHWSKRNEKRIRGKGKSASEGHWGKECGTYKGLKEGQRK